MANTATAPRTGTTFNVQSNYTAGFVYPTTLHNKPDVRKRIFDYDESFVYDFLIHAGKTMVTGNTTYSHAEMDSRWHTHTVESKTGSAGAGNVAVVTLEEVDHLDDTVVGNLSAPMINDTAFVYTATGVIKAFVTAVNKVTPTAHTVTLDPQDDTVDLVTALAASGDQITIYSNAFADGTGMPSATSRLPKTYSNYCEIFKVQKKTDGSESANVSYYEIDGSPYYYHQLVKDGDYEIRAKMENAFAFGFKNTKADPTDSTRTVYMTGGLEWYADTEGYTEPYSTSFGLADLENIRKNLDYEKAMAKQLLLAGANLNANIDTFAKGYLDNTAINWAEMGVGSASGRMLDFGIDGFRYGNFVFMKKKFNLLNEQGLTGGITQSPYPGMGFVLPWGTGQDASGRDLDTICLRYKQNDKGSRYMNTWTRGKEITNTDSFEFNHQAEAGLEIGFARQINKIYQA